MRFLKLLSVTVAGAAFLAMLAVLQARLCFDYGDAYTFFTGDTSKNCNQVTLTENIERERLKLTGVCGECATYTQFDFENYLKTVNGEIVFCEKLSDSVNYYCKADLPYSVELYGKTINLHVCIRKDGVKVASPIIFGGY